MEAGRRCHPPGPTQSGTSACNAGSVQYTSDLHPEGTPLYTARSKQTHTFTPDNLEIQKQVYVDQNFWPY